MSDVKKLFGAAVRAHRLRLGLSQETLAGRASLHRTYVTDVERGARNLSLESIWRLARALELTVSELFQEEAAASPPGSAATPNDLGPEILFVEDDPADIELSLAAFRLAHLSNHVEVLRDGAAALDFLFAHGPFSRRKNRPLPGVMLLDLRLPKIDGLEVLRRVRADPRTRHLQVIVLTHSAADTDLRQALDSGADAFLVKPLNFQAFSSVAPQLNFFWTLLPAQGKSVPARRSKSGGTRA